MTNPNAPTATRSPTSNETRRLHTVSPSASPYLFEAPVIFHSNDVELPASWQRRAVRSCCAHIHRHVRHVVRQTPFLQSPPQEALTAAKLCRHEIVTGHVVGKGGFSAVSIVQHIRLDPIVSSRLSLQENEARQLLAKSCVDHVTNQPRYVIKHLQERLLSSSLASLSPQQGKDPATVTSLPASCPAGASPRDATDDDSSGSKGGHVGNTTAFAAAAIDLILEGEYLRRLNHPNIVRLVGMPVSQGSEALRQEGRYDGFFLLLERVEMTLEDAMQAELNDIQYHNQQQQQHEQHVPSSSLSMTALDSKLEAGIQLAHALAHLHSLGIVFRDLKPQNVGIVRSHRSPENHGQQDRVVLLDFGLCRQLPCYNDHDDEAREFSNDDKSISKARRSRRQRSSSSTIQEVYHMSAVGTRRYLAVEVVNSSRYNELADVYSWSLVMWEYLTLTRPFPNYDVAQHALHVCQQGERPDVRTLPDEIRHLLGECWTEDLGARLSMDEVVALLTAIVRSHYYDRERLLHNRGVFLIDAAMDEDDEDEGEAREDAIDRALDRAFDEDMSLSISSLQHARPIQTSSITPSEVLHSKHHHAVSPLSWLLLPDDPQHKANVAMWNKLDCASVTTRSMSSDEDDDDLRMKDGPEVSSHNFFDDSLALPRDGMLVVTSKRPRGSHPAVTECSPSYGTHLTALSCCSSNASHPLFDDSDDLTSLNQHELSMSLVADPRVIASSPFDAEGTW